MARILAAFLGFLLGLMLAGNTEAGVKAGPTVHPGGHHRLKSSGPIDGFGAPAAAAYSFRKLKPSYLGKAVQLRRASDSTVLDIGFTPAGDFDTAAATTFCAATSCFAVTWYDQSGNARDATRPAAAEQPALVFGCQNGQPCLRATAVQLLGTVPTYATTLPMTFDAVAIRNSGTGQCFWPQQYGTGNFLASNTLANQWVLVGGSSTTVVLAAADAAWHVGIGVVNGASSVLRVDAAEQVGTATALTTSHQMVSFWGVAGSTCSAAEVVYWDAYALTLAERVALTANQRAYWGF